MTLLLVFLAIIFIGYPVGFALFLVPTGYILITGQHNLDIVSFTMYWSLNQFSLLAIPLFIFAGSIINAIGLTDDLVMFSKQLVGRIRGGLAHMNIAVSTLFGGINGSIVADTATVGAILIPAMKKEGYDPAFSAAITAASSSIGAVIPPSIAMIIYATMVNISIGALFIGGIFAGILMCILQMVAAYIISIHRKYPKYTIPFSLKDFTIATFKATPALIAVLIIVFGMRSGAFTATEAAAVICTYALLLGFLWYRNLSFNRLLECAFESIKLAGAIIIILGAAGPFMWILTTDQMIGDMVNAFSFLTVSPILTYVFLISAIIFAGMVMESTANCLITGPILAKIAVNAGLDPFLVAFVIIMGITMGPVTPPLGISLYTAAYLSKSKIETISKEVIPFLLVDTVAIIMVIVFPEIVKFLPRVLGYAV
jgi:tripartite ATP-independent transporter DctM subunit